MVLVVGSTGMVGNEVCQRLTRQGEKVRALVRSTSSSEKVASLRGCGVEVFVGDLKDTGSLAAACRGVDAVISTASSTLSRQVGDSIEREVVARFEEIGGRPFKLEQIPEEALRKQFEEATDSMQKSFAGLMLGYASGDAIDMTSIRREFAIKLTNIDQFARTVLGRRMTD